MKSSLSFLFFCLFCFAANGQSVGINTTAPHASAALDVQSFDQGILVPRLKTTARTGIQNPATGLLVYDIDELRFYTYDGTKWLGLSTTDAFINDFGIVRNDGDLGNDILLFAADQLPGLGSDDTLMMFHTPTGSFRAGRPASNFWIADSLGSFSFAAGAGVKASGNYSASVGTGNESVGEASFTAGIGNNATDSYSIAIGRMNDATGFGSLAIGSENLASGQYSTAMGNLTEASGGGSTAMGSQTRATGGQSTAMGIQSEAIGRYSTAMGRTTKAASRTSTAIGRFNVGVGHPTLWQEDDPLLEVGNGSDAGNLHNAMTVLKNGKTGIGTSSPDTTLSVIGVSRAAFDESETDYIEMSHGGANAFINAAGTGNLDIRHGGTNVLTITPLRRVGIRTNTPKTDLSVIGKVRAAIDVVELEYTEIFHGGDNGYINTVGDGDLQFRHDDDTKMYLTDEGDLYVNGAIVAGNPTSTPVEGMIKYNSISNKLDIYTGTEWEEVGAFTNDNGVVRSTGSNNSDFVFGYNSLPGPGSNPSENLFFFDEDIGAFRTGEMVSTKWNTNNLGENSFASGSDNIASGSHSATIGFRTASQGDLSFSTGAYSSSSGQYSVAMGQASVASGIAAISLGSGGFATGDYSVALGQNIEATGLNAVAIGKESSAIEESSISIGSDGIRDYLNVGPFPTINAPYSSGKNAVAIGTGVIASGNFSTAIGLDSEASGIGAVAMGEVDANSFRCVSIGQGNVGGADPDDWILTDPIFEVGIGFPNSPKNAFTVLKSGNVGINIWNPIHPLHVGTDPTNGNGAYLTVGGTWTNSSSRTFKDHFEIINPREILHKLNEINVLKWKYKSSEEGYHLGPMAEDFYDAFGLGDNEKYISSVDADGVALAAIQGLYQENQQLKAELDAQKEEIESLKSMMQELVAKIDEK